MTTINATNLNNQVSFGKREHKKASVETDSQTKSNKLETGAKILGALAVTGGAIYGAISLAKRGKAINNKPPRVKYFGTPELRKIVEQQEVEHANKIVAEMKATDARTKGIVHQNREKGLQAMDWDMKPMTKQEILAERAAK